MLIDVISFVEPSAPRAAWEQFFDPVAVLEELETMEQQVGERIEAAEAAHQTLRDLEEELQEQAIDPWLAAEGR